MNVLRHSNFCPDRLLAKDRAHSDQQKMSRWIESPESVPTIRFSVSRSSNEHPRSPPATLKTFGQVRVHVLYKRAEIPANTMIPAFAVSVTIGNRRRRRIRVRPPLALPNYLESSACKMRVQGLPLRRSVTERPRRDSRSNGARRLELWQAPGRADVGHISKVISPSREWRMCTPVPRVSSTDVSASFSSEAHSIADRAGQQSSGVYRNKLISARSMISSPRPLRTAFIMNRLKPLACSRVIAGGIASS